MILYGFKYEEYGYGSGDRHTPCYFILLEEAKDKYFLNIKMNNEFNRIEITDRVDAFCRSLLEMNINEWNQRKFDGTLELFPSFWWKLEIIAENINVVCSGRNTLPGNWGSFRSALNILCGNADPDYPFVVEKEKKFRKKKYKRLMKQLAGKT